MIAKNLQVNNFRNIEFARIELHPELTVLHGRNAQGKTNMLEAVFVASWGKSFRTQRENELIRDGANSASVNLLFDSAGREQNITCRFFRDGVKAEDNLKNSYTDENKNDYEKNNDADIGNCISAPITLAAQKRRREIEINGIPVKKSAELYGRFAAVLFVPAHLEIVRGAPEERRKFLDMALCREKPTVLTLMNNYRRALEQRNRVLKDMQRFSGLDDMLSVWDSRLAQLGSALSAQRAAFCEKLAKSASRIYAELAGGEEFIPEFEPGAGTDPDTYAEMLAKTRADDERIGHTSVGAHRDDIKITVGGRDGRRFASQGQQRSAVISMKLAEAELLRAATGETPVLLLDDVLSELDAGRRGFLLERITGMQRIVTACDASEFSDCAVYEVSAGSFTRV